MENNNENKSGLELADRINASLTEPKHRFEFYDPFMETKLTFKTSNEAVAKADELGATTFQSVSFNGELSNIKKTDGEWIRIDNDEPLTNIQAEIDHDSLGTIKSRAEQRIFEAPVDTTIDAQMALADAIDFQRIQDSSLQEAAAVVIAENTREYPDYKDALTANFTGYPKTAQLIEELDAGHAQKLEITRAAIDMLKVLEPLKKETNATEIPPNGNRAKTTLEASGSESNKPPKKTRKTPKKPQLDALDPAALAFVAASRERDSENARKVLDSNTIEPDFEKQQQQLSSEDDAKRSAWLNKTKKVDIDDTQSTPSAKSSSNNKVESDEIFTANKSEIKPIIPPEIEKRFLRVGDKFYHPKNTDLMAFEDKGNKLETKSNSENIAQTMVLIAEARGWDEIKVSGTESFRKEVWREAASRGMHVKGYTPTEQDKAALDKQISTSEANKVEPDNKPFRARENANEQINEDKPNKNPFSEIVDHGAAKYLHENKNDNSYYVTTRDEQGAEKTSWGVDLKRAMSESGAKIGDKVLVTNEGPTKVPLKVPVRDDNGEISHYEEKEVKRNSWNVKMAETFAKESPAEAVKQHPELAGAAAIVDAINKKATEHGLSPEQLVIVNARVRKNVVNSIERGDLPQTKIKEDVTREVKHEKEQSR